MIILISGLSGLVTLALWIPGSSSTAAIIVFGAVYGFTSGGYISMAPAVIAQISDIRQIGTRIGITFIINAVAALAGSPIGGAIVNRTRASGADANPYLGLQLFCGVVMLLGAVSFVFARHAQVGFKLARV